ncbi:MAG: TonB C-terminal domain-containing protein [Gammaproteobacteria bacterium]|nr:TonB C-terminal domain-containing protein [Gammaproteobacteria bacterium]
MAGLLQSVAGDQSPGSKVWKQRIAIVLAVLLLVIGMAWVVKSLMTGNVSAKKPVTTIKIMPDTPPPPPPPKEPPKEQPKEQPKEIKMEQPKPQQTPQTPAEELKMEGAAGDGPSPFGAGAVSNDYNGQKIGGKGMAAYAWYTDQIKTSIEEALAAQKELVKVQYRVSVHIWLTRDGRVERAELKGSSGDPATDKLIRKALAGLSAISEALPEDMPQPVKLRITSKNAG